MTTTTSKTNELSPAELAAKHAQAAILHLQSIAATMPRHGPSAEYDELASIAGLVDFWLRQVTNPDN